MFSPQSLVGVVGVTRPVVSHLIEAQEAHLYSGRNGYTQLSIRGPEMPKFGIWNHYDEECPEDQVAEKISDRQLSRIEIW